MTICSFVDLGRRPISSQKIAIDCRHVEQPILEELHSLPVMKMGDGYTEAQDPDVLYYAQNFFVDALVRSR